MILPCAKCGKEVPLGASSCPHCGAGLASMVLSKERRGLSKTLIGKAIELRNSIPWANPSQIVLLDDPRRPGKKKVRPVAGIVIALLSVGLVAETIYLLTRPAHDVFEVVTAPPETRPIDPPLERALAKPEKAEKVEKVEKAPEKVVEKAPEKAPEKVAKAEPPPPPLVPAPPAPKPAPVAAKAAPPPPAAKANGTLVVVTRHGGKQVTGAIVRINGVNLGPTPVNTSVIPGVYTVKIDKAGFKTEKRPDVEVRSSKKVVLTFDLKK